MRRSPPRPPWPLSPSNTGYTMCPPAACGGTGAATGAIWERPLFSPKDRPHPGAVPARPLSRPIPLTLPSVACCFCSSARAYCCGDSASEGNCRLQIWGTGHLAIVLHPIARYRYRVVAWGKGIRLDGPCISRLAKIVGKKWPDVSALPHPRDEVFLHLAILLIKLGSQRWLTTCPSTAISSCSMCGHTAVVAARQAEERRTAAAQAPPPHRSPA